MSAHSTGFPPAWLWAFVERSNRWPLRAVGRGLTGSMPVGALWSALSDLPSAMPGGDRMLDLGIAAGSIVAIFLLLRWWSHGQGFAFALKLALASWLFLQALEAAAVAAYLAAGMNGELTDWGFVTFLAAIGIGLFIPTYRMLNRLDPDY
jgi:hypothetical protein